MAEYIKNISIKDFTQLKVWQKSFELTSEIYKITATFPTFETYAMKSQIIRSASSIAANIAEGNGQLYKKKEINFYNNSLGSATETKNWLLIALNQNYITKDQFNNLDARLTEIIKMLIGCIKRVLTDMKAIDIGTDANP